jgi:ParB/RepB/Spo0J family partition protein
MTMHEPPTNPALSRRKSQLTHLQLEQVVPCKSNPRGLTFEKEPFHELKKSIEQNGLLQPIVVRPRDERFEIIGGHRRFKAVTELAREHPSDARFTSIAAVVKEADDAMMVVLQLAENLNRADLSPLEVAEGIAAAVDKGTSKEQLADSLGWQTRKLYRYLQLDAAPAWLKEFAKEVRVPKKRVDEKGAPVLDPVTNAVVHDFETKPGLGYTDVMELVVLHNALHDRDVEDLKSHSRADFKPQAERVTRKLAYAAASEQWPTSRLRAETKRAKDPAEAKASAKRANKKKQAYTITSEQMTIDLTRIHEMTREEKDELALIVVNALGSVGFAAVINPMTR